MPKFVPIGSFVAINGEAHQLTIQATFGQLHISLVNQHSLFLNYKFESQEEAPDVIPITQSAFVCPEWNEGVEVVSIKAGENTLLVEKSTLAWRWMDVNQAVYLETDALNVAMEGSSTTAHFVLRHDERFVGLGEKTGPINKRGRQYENWNTDKFAYHEEDDPMYCSVPFYMGSSGGLWYGVFVNNSGRTHFNFGASNHRFSFVRTQNGHLGFYLFGAPNPADIIGRYTALTGRTPLPPLWSLGYQQCRYSYYPEAEFELLADGFRKKQIPCDVLYFDIHYMDAYKVFTWDKNRFENPLALHRKLHDAGFKTVAILDPGLKVESGFEVDEEALERDMVLKYPDGEVYVGEAWPGECHFPDFGRSDVRRWWAKKVEAFSQCGVDGLWNDMNEPAVWGKHFPDAVRFGTDSGTFGHADVHNAYGGWMAQATFEGLSDARAYKRPFVLTRAGYAGVQKYAAVWTGDNSASPGQLMLSCRMVAGMGLSGLPFAGADVGGFIGDTWSWLFSRWVQVGAFHPLFRGHNMVNARDAEPWSFGEETEEICRNYIGLRYRLLPLMYTLFYEHTLNGLAPVRPMCLLYPNDGKAYDPAFDSQFFLGRDVLVCPVAQHSGFVKVYLPEGRWYDLLTDKLFDSGEHILEVSPNYLPVFVREGGFLAAQTLVQHTGERAEYEEWHLYYGEGKGERYLDEGDGYAHLEGRFSLRRLEWNVDRIRIFKKEGVETEGKLRLYLHGWKGDLFLKTFERETYRWVNPISNFDPYFRDVDDSLKLVGLPYVDLDLNSLNEDWVLVLGS